MVKPQHGGAVVIMGANGMGGNIPTPSNPKALAMIPLPKGFDLGDAQPGDKIDVTAHCQVSDDGEHLEILTLDGSGDDDDDQPDADDQGGEDDGDDSPGNRWASMKGRQAAADSQ